jgi:class 3 adenylate cyclase
MKGVAEGTVTLLFTDIEGSTLLLRELGDRYEPVLDDHRRLLRAAFGAQGGTEVDTAGDGFFATFDGPARGIRCASAIRESVRSLGIEIRAGVHTGECELVGEKVAGIAVHTAARVNGLARPSEVLVSSTVKDLVAGSGIEFVDRGEHELKGVPGVWRLYAATGL